MTTFYVTTPIYYVNDAPHIGHAYTTVVADTLARWHRLCGHDVRFQTGTDEHGQKVMRAAERAGRTPQAHADLLHVRFKELVAALDVVPDVFIRTTEPRHAAVVQMLLQRLYDQGEIYAADYSGWYSTSAERFWTEEEVATASHASVEELRAGKVAGVCPDSGTPVEWLTERNWFFRMSAYQDRLVAWIEAHPTCIQPASRRNEVLGYLRKPLGDLCISRPAARLPWGIPLPFAPEYVTYVWFDALTNYVSGLGYGTDGGDFDRYWPSVVHLLGKDILTFHTVYWFSMLMAAGIALPRTVYAHGWWLARGTKMSKSLGNVVKPEVLIEHFGADALRYFFLREIPFGGDGEFSYVGFQNRYNADLANDLGNLAHRALSMTEKWLDGVVPAATTPSAADEAFQAIGIRATAEFALAMDTIQPRQAIEALWEFVRAGNKYVDTEQPWTLNKVGDRARLGQVLRNALECCRITASYLSCVMPRRGAELLDRLGLAAPDLAVGFDVIPAGARVAAREPLFPRVAELPSEIAALEAAGPPVAAPASPIATHPPRGTAAKPAPEPALSTASPSAAPPISEGPAPGSLPPEITYEDFAKLALRTARIVAAERHPNADRLLVLKVDAGEPELRTIVAGIAAVYKPEDLVGRTVTIVANLKPAKLRGVMSQGMLLAAGGADVAALLSPITDVPPGTIVK